MLELCSHLQQGTGNLPSCTRMTNGAGVPPGLRPCQVGGRDGQGQTPLWPGAESQDWQLSPKPFLEPQLEAHPFPLCYFQSKALCLRKSVTDHRSVPCMCLHQVSCVNVSRPNLLFVKQRSNQDATCKTIEQTERGNTQRMS